MDNSERDNLKPIPLGRRILVSFMLSWITSVSLGILFGASAVGRYSIVDLWVMAVIPVAMMISTVVALLGAPLVVWTLRRYSAVKWILLLWILMGVWIVAMLRVTQKGPLVLESAVVLTVGGMLLIRFKGNQ